MKGLAARPADRRPRPLTREPGGFRGAAWGASVAILLCLAPFAGGCGGPRQGPGSDPAPEAPAADPPVAEPSPPAAPAPAALELPRDVVAGLAAGPPRPQRSGVLFTLLAPDARSVAVAGAFNGWVPTRHFLARRDSLWYGLVPIPRGRHPYRYVVDGVLWMLDPENAERTGDGFGGHASLVVVR